MLANGTLFKHLIITPLKLQVWCTTWLVLSENLLVRNGWAEGGRARCVREPSAGRAGGLANVRDILIYDKRLLLKLPVCAKYVIVISEQMAL